MQQPDRSSSLIVSSFIREFRARPRMGCGDSPGIYAPIVFPRATRAASNPKVLTMALFIGGLAFEDAGRLDAAKIGVLGASLLTGLAGWLFLRRALAASATTGAR